jgi:hypothetical protein
MILNSKKSMICDICGAISFDMHDDGWISAKRNDVAIDFADESPLYAHTKIHLCPNCVKRIRGEIMDVYICDS